MLHPIIIYDGVCRLCNRLNHFVLRRDGEGIFRFASLQSPLAARILARHVANPQDLDTVYVVLDHDLTQEAQPDGRLLPRSDAVIFVLKRLGGIWKVLGLFVQLLPRFLRHWGYLVVARLAIASLAALKPACCPVHRTAANSLTPDVQPVSEALEPADTNLIG